MIPPLLEALLTASGPSGTASTGSSVSSGSRASSSSSGDEVAGSISGVSGISVPAGALRGAAGGAAFSEVMGGI